MSKFQKNTLIKKIKILNVNEKINFFLALKNNFIKILFSFYNFLFYYLSIIKNTNHKKIFYSQI